MAQLFLTDDGSHSLFSEQYGVSYHSKFGAIKETQHVFIDAALKHYVEKTGQKELKILEIGFGTGLNALMTLAEASKNDLRIDYTTYEAYPLSIEAIELLNYPFEVENGLFKSAFFSMHQAAWQEQCTINAQFSLKKVKDNFEHIDVENQFDIIYYDAFAPQAQPDLWEIPMLEKMFNALKPNGIITTYCAKGSVKRNLKTLGFEVEAIPGPPGKREMTRARKIITQKSLVM